MSRDELLVLGSVLNHPDEGVVVEHSLVVDWCSAVHLVNLGERLDY